MYQQFFVLFAIIFTGFALKRIGIIDDAMNKGLNRFIVYFAYPCLIILRIGSLELSEGLLTDFVYMLLLTLVFFAVYSGVSYGYVRLRGFSRINANVVELAMASPNNGFMGLPIALLFFGEKGLLLMIAHNAAMNIYFFSYGLLLLRRNKRGKEKAALKAMLKEGIKLILNPNILSLFIGMIICLNRLTMPLVVTQYLGMIGNIATPMAMIFIGSTLAGSSFKSILMNRTVVEASLNKLILMPLMTYVILIFTPLKPLIIATAVLGAAFPSAATVSILAEQEEQDKEIASQILFLSTLISMVTLSVILNAILTFVL
jgi:predicted permease